MEQKTDTILIRANDIVRRYDSLEVLKGVSIEIPRAQITAIVGPSGAGKTTLLQIIGTLDRPDRGKVLYGDTDVFTLSPDKVAAFRNRNIGFIFQFHQLLPEFSLLENVALPAMIAGDTRAEAFAKAQKLISYLGLEQRASHRPGELSGGERQRGAVARALVNSPEVILADEPTGSLDSANRREMQKLFFDLRRDFGHTFVIVTHDETLAADADRVVRMRDGMIENI